MKFIRTALLAGFALVGNLPNLLAQPRGQEPFEMSRRASSEWMSTRDFARELRGHDPRATVYVDGQMRIGVLGHDIIVDPQTSRLMHEGSAQSLRSTIAGPAGEQISREAVAAVIKLVKVIEQGKAQQTEPPLSPDMATDRPGERSEMRSQVEQGSQRSRTVRPSVVTWAKTTLLNHWQIVAAVVLVVVLVVRPLRFGLLWFVATLFAFLKVTGKTLGRIPPFRQVAEMVGDIWHSITTRSQLVRRLAHRRRQAARIQAESVVSDAVFRIQSIVAHAESDVIGGLHVDEQDVREQVLQAYRSAAETIRRSSGLTGDDKDQNLKLLKQAMQSSLASYSKETAK